MALNYSKMIPAHKPSTEELNELADTTARQLKTLMDDDVNFQVTWVDIHKILAKYCENRYQDSIQLKGNFLDYLHRSSDNESEKQKLVQEFLFLLNQHEIDTDKLDIDQWKNEL